MGENREEHTLFGRGSGDCEPISVSYCCKSASERPLCERHFTAPRPLSYPHVKSDRLLAKFDKSFTQESIESGFCDLALDIRHQLDFSNGQNKKTKDDGDGKQRHINGISTAYRNSSAQNRNINWKEGIAVQSNDVTETLTLRAGVDSGDSKRRFQSFYISPRPFVDSELSDRNKDKNTPRPAVPNNTGRGTVCSIHTKTDIASVNKRIPSSGSRLISNSDDDKRQAKGLTSEHLHTNAIISERESDAKRNFVDKDARPPRSRFNERVYISISTSATHTPLASGELHAPLDAKLSSGQQAEYESGRTNKAGETGPVAGINCTCDFRTSNCHSATGAKSSNLAEDEVRVTDRKLQTEMGNSVQRRACESKKSPPDENSPEQYTTNRERLTEPQTTQRRNQSGGEKTKNTDGIIEKGGGKIVRTIPELIVSDSSMDQELENEKEANRYCQAPSDPSDIASYTVIRPTNGDDPQMFTSKNTVDFESSDKLPLRPHPSTDSAYSSDSKSTLPDGSGEHGLNADSAETEGAESKEYASPVEHKELLKPSTKTPDARSISSSSSSSSSSSPCHPPSWHDISHASSSTTTSESTLRVMSDIGTQRKLSSSSGSSFRSSLSFEESEDDMLSSDGESMLREHMARKGRRQSKAQSSWTKIRRMVIWSPFMQSFKKKYPWVQLAGHTGNFQPGEEGCILKKYCAREAECLSQLSTDSELRPFAPEYHGIVEKDGEQYTRMQDLLLAFDCPSVMDCKMGIRTYLEDELVKAKIRPRLRHDMYKKMTEIAPDEPTPEEHEARAVTKPRYMQWREHVSSSSNLGFRIEGIKKGENEPSKDYKLTKTKEQVKNAFKYFIDENVGVLEKYIKRLKDVRSATEKSDFFMTHEVIGSSLLFVHDRSGIASTWMIDFGKTSQLPDNRRLTHREPWLEGNREDGYLYGLDNLISIFEDILNDLKTKPRVQTSNDDDGESAVDDTSARPASLLTTWTFSSQDSSESVDFPAQDGLSDADGEPARKPPLRRQVAATNSCDDSPTVNGDATAVRESSPPLDGATKYDGVIVQNSITFPPCDVTNDFTNSDLRTNGLVEDQTSAGT